MFLWLKLFFFDKNNYAVCSRDSGIGDNFFQAARVWRYAKKTGRTLIINWNRSPYLPDKRANAFTHFFDCPDEIDGVKVLKFDRIPIWFNVLVYVNTHGWNFFILLLIKIMRKFYYPKIVQAVEKTAVTKNLNQEIDLVQGGTKTSKKIVGFFYCLSFISNEEKKFFYHIQPSQRIEPLIRDFEKKHFLNKKVIGIHVRYLGPELYGSKYPDWIHPEENMKRIKTILDRVIQKINSKNHVIFLATDHIMPLQFIQKHFPQVIVYPKNLQKAEENKELHFQKTDYRNSLATHVEMFLLAKSTVLIRARRSWFSTYASLYAGEVILCYQPPSPSRESENS